VGYDLHLRGSTGLQLYVDARGLVRGSKDTQADTRRYYGIGGKVTL